jgi:peptidoglycan lytic transglycosylase
MRGRWVFRVLLTSLGILAGLAGAVSPGRAESGIAAVYSYRGGRTASGERARPAELTAAHRKLPFGTLVRVTNRGNGHTVVVRINDRGPFTRGRVIDLTPAAAGKLGFSGLARVSLDVIEKK